MRNPEQRIPMLLKQIHVAERKGLKCRAELALRTAGAAGHATICLSVGIAGHVRSASPHLRLRKMIAVVFTSGMAATFEQNGIL